MDVPTQMMYGGGSVRKFQTGGGIPPQAVQQMKAFNLYDSARVSGREEIIRKIRQEAIARGVDPDLAVATAMAESGLNPMAVSTAGAQGLFQLMPSTQTEVGVSDPFNVDENVSGGVSYIGKMAERFNRPEDAIRAYNWGQGNMGRYLSGDASVGRIPEETRNYLTRVQTIQNLLGYNPIVGEGSDLAGTQTAFSPDRSYRVVPDAYDDDFPQTPFSPDGVGYSPAPDLTMQSQVPESALTLINPRELGYNFDSNSTPEEIRRRNLIEGILSRPPVLERNNFNEVQLQDMPNSDLEFIYQARSEASDPGRAGYGASPEDVLELTGRRMGVGYRGMTEAERQEVLNSPDRFTLENYTSQFASKDALPDGRSSVVDQANNFAPPGPSPVTEYGAINFDALAGSEGKKDTTTKDSSNMLKSGKLQPLFDAMLRGGLEFASGKNIGEAGIAGLNQATTLAQQRRENDRRDAAEKLAERVGESTITLNEARAKSLRDTYYQAAEIAKTVLAKDPNFLTATPAEQQRLLSELISSIQSRGLGGGISGIPANTERFNAAFGAM